MLRVLETGGESDTQYEILERVFVYYQQQADNRIAMILKLLEDNRSKASRRMTNGTQT